MSTRTLSNSWWVDFRHEGRRIRVKSPENTRAGAAHYEAVLRQRLARGEPLVAPQPVPRLRFNAFAWRWYETYVTTNNKPSEQKSKRIILRKHLVPHFGNLLLDAITPLKIEEFKTIKLNEGLAPKSVNNFLAVLGKCLRTAEEWGEIERVPKLRHLKVPPQKFDFLSVDESERLIRAAPSARWKLMITVALRTGLRLGELLALDWSDISLETCIITVRRSAFGSQIVSPKSNRIRYVPLAPEVQRALQQIQRPNGLVFSRQPAIPVNEKVPRRAIIRTCEQAGLRRIGWHVLRHTFASQLVIAGVNMKAVQELLGHSDIRVTMRYAHLAPSTLHDAVRVLEERVVANQDFGQPVGNALTTQATRESKTPQFAGRF